MTSPAAHPASFRDPSGFVFRRDGELLRQVNAAYAPEWQAVLDSGLLPRLHGSGRLIAHREVDLRLALAPGAIAVLSPEPVATVSYPYEWSFSQLKEAALLTLDLQAEALAVGLTLKDASAYNVQFHRGRPVFIDTLSFERRTEGAPWAAYRQFCQHFLAPLALMSRVDIRLSQLLRVHLDGPSLDLASALLPVSSWLSPGLLLHVHLHARTQRRHADAGGAAPAKAPTITQRAFEGLIASLRSAVQALDWTPAGTEWADYYERNNNYGDEGLQRKAEILAAMLERVAPRTVWDLGGNTGRFSRVAAAQGAEVVTWDVDPACVEANWRQVRRSGETRVLPLLLDLTNPSADVGWAGEERSSLAARGPVDCVLALGLIHHLAIANNVPLERIARFFAALGRSLVLELVPREDSQVQRLLASRRDVFPDYNAAGFEEAFQQHFRIEERAPIPGTARTLYRLSAL